MPELINTIRIPASEQEWRAYYHFRWQQLRAPWQQPPGSERDEWDNKAEHRICLVNDSIIAAGRLHMPANQHAQIRYMAVDPVYQGQGFGSAILNSLEQAAQQHSATNIILHARETALPFYLKHGYRKIEPSHTLYGEIKHFLMEKQL